MPDERKKSTMISARLPTALVDRVDYVSRNIDSEATKNRSGVVRAALESFLPAMEDRLRVLGVLPKKGR